MEHHAIDVRPKIALHSAALLRRGADRAALRLTAHAAGARRAVGAGQRTLAACWSAARHATGARARCAGHHGPGGLTVYRAVARPGSALHVARIGRAALDGARASVRVALDGAALARARDVAGAGVLGALDVAACSRGAVDVARAPAGPALHDARHIGRTRHGRRTHRPAAVEHARSVCTTRPLGTVFVRARRSAQRRGAAGRQSTPERHGHERDQGPPPRSHRLRA
jgi:hypothetical protein